MRLILSFAQMFERNSIGIMIFFFINHVQQTFLNEIYPIFKADERK